VPCLPAWPGEFQDIPEWTKSVPFPEETTRERH
jgi:hypothetical protein